MRHKRATASPGPCSRSFWSPLMTVTNRASAVRALRLRLEPAVRPAVAEVEREADRQPHAEPQPVGPAEAVDHRAADDDAERRDDLNRRHAEGALEVGPL